MKKFVSMFLAVCALSSMSVNAFAQQADAINVTSDEKLKLSFKENRELETLPEQIIQWEAEHEEGIAAISAPDYYTSHTPLEIKADADKLQELEDNIAKGYARWEELEAKKALIESSK